jgi:Rps23 Pro-64 3,4-dihydroxylase Tpa1-like proline 4-hydroxylase
MAMLNVINDGHSFFFAQTQPSALRSILQQKYHAAEPFHHLAIDYFLPLEFIESILAAFPDKSQASVSHTKAHQLHKRGYRPHMLGNNPCRHYLSLFNTPPVLPFLEEVTGIEGLIPDPYFVGGGLHEIERGGKLNVHADFTLHEKLNLVRRINLLIYLNKAWQSDYGGKLELWDSNMKQCVKSIEPKFNRAVIFTTDKQSFHGHPEPLNCPPDMTRRSIALYYYVAPSTMQIGKGISSQTDWKVRPGTSDNGQSNQRTLLKRIVKKLKG